MKKTRTQKSGFGKNKPRAVCLAVTIYAKRRNHRTEPIRPMKPNEKTHHRHLIRRRKKHIRETMKTRKRS